MGLRRKTGADNGPEKVPAGGAGSKGVRGKVIIGSLEKVGGNREEVSFTSLKLLS